MAVAPDEQAARLLRIGSKMKIGEQDLVRLEPAILDGLRLLHLDDHVGVGEHGLCCRQDAGAGLLVVASSAKMPAPAPDCTTTSWPRAVNSRTEPGTSPTLNSLHLISVGTPMRMMTSESGEFLSWSRLPEAVKIVGVLLSDGDSCSTILRIFSYGR